MADRQQLKEIARVQKELLNYERQHRLSAKVQARINKATTILARAHYAHVGEELDEATAKAQQVLDAFERMGARGIAYRGYDYKPVGLY